jgi:hypothetical protein
VLVEPDVELAWLDWFARVAFSVTNFFLSNSLSPDLCLECVANRAPETATIGINTGEYGPHDDDNRLSMSLI